MAEEKIICKDDARLHLLPRHNARHPADVVVLTFGVPLNEVEYFFFIGFITHSFVAHKDIKDESLDCRLLQSIIL